MKRPWKVLVLLLGVQAALSATAATIEWAYACGSCRAGGLSLGLVGFAFYTGLFIAALYAGPGRIVFGAVLLGFGVHVMLVGQLIATGKLCWICLTAAGVSAVMAGLSIACDRANLARMAFALPWAALLTAGLRGFGPPPVTLPPDDEPGVRVVVFTQPDCPYCEDLRANVMPQAKEEFGSRIRVSYRPADRVPAIRRVPTIVVSAGPGRRHTRVIEGLPSYGKLREAISEIEGHP